MTNTDKCVHLGGTARSPQDVEALHELGLQFAEIPVTDPAKLSRHVHQYKELKDRLGLYYLCHGPREGDPNDTHALGGEYLAKVMETLPLMQSLGISLLTIHLWLDPRFVWEKTVQFKIELLKRIVNLALEGQIAVCVENLSETPADMEISFREIPLLQMTLDLGHAQLLTDTNRSHDFLGRFPDRIKHIHMHDNRGGGSYLDDIHLPPGDGIIDFENIFDRLKQVHYSRTITLELKPEEIRACLPYVRRLIAGLGSYY